MAEGRERESDMILAPNEFMFVQDNTKGHVDCYVGPTKQSLSGTDQPVVFDEKSKRFVAADYNKATQLQRTAPEGWYIVLKNPSKDGKHPNSSGKVGSAELEIGRKVNVPGPVSFCLWPGQMAKVLKGHHLRSNQYLIVRVYDEEQALANWGKAVVKAASPDSGGDGGDPPKTGTGAGNDPGEEKEPGGAITPEGSVQLTMGKLLVIKGTDVSFYMPSNGIEVVPDDDGNLVRDAVTLERLEYCLLIDENGDKRYVQGPNTVFPSPTEVFHEAANAGGDKTRKFQARELESSWGIHIKVTAPYEEDGKSYRVGDELFITGKEQRIYFPRAEHAIIHYDDSEIHYGIAIPDGEARYVLDRESGTIDLVKGPQIFLPDPRRQVVVRRILDFNTCSHLYPGNEEAARHNASAAGVDMETYESFDDEAPMAVATAALDVNAEELLGANYSAPLRARRLGDSRSSRGLDEKTSTALAGDRFSRPTAYTKPRTITLSTKYEGAVSVDVWTGYALMLVRKSGERRVVQGPRTVLLEYDETPHVMELSTGKPKTTDRLFKTAYLRTTANKVSDIVEGVRTKDFCELKLKLSYRVNFEGEPEEWFAVENYVKFMCDHMRSKIRNAVLKFGIEEFFSDYAAKVRDIVLGAHTDEGRHGTAFEENGMRIYDVEVLGLEMANGQGIQDLLVKSRREAVNTTLELTMMQQRVDAARRTEALKREEEDAKAESERHKAALDQERIERGLEIALAKVSAGAKEMEARILTSKLEAESAIEIAEFGVKKDKLRADFDHANQEREQALRLAMLRAEVEAVVEQAKAVSGDLAAAISRFGDQALVEKLTASMSPLAILGGSSVVDVTKKLLEGTALASALTPPNGHSGTSSPRLSPRE